ncbi:MAG: hypothetical protein QME63_09160 [Actinomycetota bacterium]|nr:hypothetical protein [Actinomycetota bacterium]
MVTIQAAKKTAPKQRERYREQPRTGKKLRVVEAKRNRLIYLPTIPFPLFILSVSILTIGAMINTAQQALIAQQGYEIESIKRDIQLAQQEHDRLLALKARLESPQRIEKIATTKLLMVNVPKVSYLQISSDSSKVSKLIRDRDYQGIASNSKSSSSKEIRAARRTEYTGIEKLGDFAVAR